MDRKKLNKAAENHFMTAVPYFHCSDTVRSCVDKAFKAGASWLMQQPLSERLTEEEKERIRKEYNLYKDSWNETELTETTMESFEEIFGTDLFKEK